MKKSLKELNWKKLMKKIILSWFHIIGIVSCFFTAFFMTIAFYCFIVYGGIIFYEINLIISVIEFIIGIIAMIYCLCFLINIFQRIK